MCVCVCLFKFFFYFQQPFPFNVPKKFFFCFNFLVQYHKLIHLEPLNLTSPCNTTNSSSISCSYNENTSTAATEIPVTTLATTATARKISSTLPKNFEINLDLYKFPTKFQYSKKHDEKT